MNIRSYHYSCSCIDWKDHKDDSYDHNGRDGLEILIAKMFDIEKKMGMNMVSTMTLVDYYNTDCSFCFEDTP